MPDPTSDYTPAIRALIDYFSSRVRQNLPAPDPETTDFSAPPTPPPPPGAFQPDQPVVGSPLLAQILRRVLDSGDPRLKAQVGPVVQGLTPSLIAQATEADVDPNAYNYGAMGYPRADGRASIIMGRTDDPDPTTGRSAISVSPAYSSDQERLGALMHELTHVTGDPDRATGSYPEEARALWNAKAPVATDDERSMNAMIQELLKLRDDPRFQAVSPRRTP